MCERDMAITSASLEKSQYIKYLKKKNQTDNMTSRMFSGSKSMDAF